MTAPLTTSSAMSDHPRSSSDPARWPSATMRAALALGIVLRIVLALVNRDANDPHLPVVRILAYEHRIPAKTEAWEAFQPKLWHATVAGIWNALSVRSVDAQIVTAQLVSCTAGILTLVVLWWFLRDRRESPAAKTIAFALVALSPGLVGINAQATNDSFVIL